MWHWARVAEQVTGLWHRAGVCTGQVWHRARADQVTGMIGQTVYGRGLARADGAEGWG